jgi:hypothetical protein
MLQNLQRDQINAMSSGVHGHPSRPHTSNTAEAKNQGSGLASWKSVPQLKVCYTIPLFVALMTMILGNNHREHDRGSLIHESIVIPRLPRFISILC